MRFHTALTMVAAACTNALVLRTPPLGVAPHFGPPAVHLRHRTTQPMLSVTPEPSEGQGPMPAAVGAGLMLALFSATPAEAAAAAPNALPSAFCAYGHYLGLILSVGALATERFTVKPEMTEEEEKRIAIADAVYGLAGLLIVVTGYFRVTLYGKGWEFYSHEPIFWLKLVLVSVMGAASFFPTTKIIQRSVKLQNEGSVAPMGDKLANRMTSIINAELLAIGSIPLAAALMARGVGYADWFPWQAGAALVAVALGGLGYKYVKEGKLPMPLARASTLSLSLFQTHRRPGRRARVRAHTFVA